MKAVIPALALLLLSLPASALPPGLGEKARSADSFERSEAARLLGREGSPEAARIVVTLLSDRSPYVRDAAVRACRGFTSEPAVAVLAAAARGREERLRWNAAEALGRTRAEGALEPLARLAGKDRSLRVRAQALDGLWGYRGNAKAMAICRAAFRDPVPLVRAAAVEAAGRMRAEGALALVRAALADPDEGVRCVARMELRYLAPGEAAAGLAAAAGDASWRIRAQAVDDARYLRRRESVDVLIGLLADPVLRVAAAAHRALTALTGKEIDPDPALWRAWWKEARKGWKPGKGKGRAPRDYAKAPARYHGLPVTSTRVAFVIDASGSMARPVPGDSSRRTGWETARAELLRTLDALPRETVVQVIVFHERVMPALPSPRPLGGRTRKAIASALSRVTPGHAGDLLAAVLAALDTPGLDTVILLSDGAPSFGETVDKGRVRAAVRQVNRMRKLALHTIAFGSRRDSERRFLEGLARDAGGRALR